MDPTEGPWSPEEDEMLINLIVQHGYHWSLIVNSIPGKSVETCSSRSKSLFGKDGFLDQTAGRWSPEEDRMLINLFLEHRFCWSLIGNSIPGKSPAKCWARWRSDESWRSYQSSGKDEIDEDEIEMLPKLVEKHSPNSSPPVITIVNEIDALVNNLLTNEDITISDHNIPDLTLRLALGGVSDQAPSNGYMAMETGSQNSIYEGNSSHEVGGMVSGQPPSISDMARGNMSSGGTHSYSRDHSAPSWNALYKRDSSPMMIDSDSVQQFVGSEFGRNDFSEVSSKA